MVKLHDFFNFKKLITSAVVKAIYILGAILITGAGLLSIGVGIQFGLNGILSAIVALFSILLFNLLWRLWCEFIIVIFSIHELLQDIKNKTKK